MTPELDAHHLAQRLSNRSPAGIAGQIGELIEDKTLPADSRLPTVRDLAQELGVSVGTIAQAWSILREQSLVETRRRGGTRVLPRARRMVADFAGPGAPLTRLGFELGSGIDPTDPAAGLHNAVELMQLAESLGFHSAWLEQHHGQPAISSPLAVMVAASQRTSQLELGVGIAPLPGDTPDTALRLAEDLATADVLAGGRVHSSLELPAEPSTAESSLIGGLADLLSGGAVDLAPRQGDPEHAGGFQRTGRVHPQTPGLRSRLWGKAFTLEGAAEAGRLGVNLLVPHSGSPAEAAEHIKTFRNHHPDGPSARTALRLTVVPTDTASQAQEQRYTALPSSPTGSAAAARGGAAGLQVGPSDEIVEHLLADPAYLDVDEVICALPAGLGVDDHRQILTDIATVLAPALGWTRRPGH